MIAFLPSWKTSLEISWINMRCVFVKAKTLGDDKASHKFFCLLGPHSSLHYTFILAIRGYVGKGAITEHFSNGNPVALRSWGLQSGYFVFGYVVVSADVGGCISFWALTNYQVDVTVCCYTIRGNVTEDSSGWASEVGRKTWACLVQVHSWSVQEEGWGEDRWHITFPGDISPTALRVGNSSTYAK